MNLERRKVADLYTDPAIEPPSNIEIGEDLDVGSFARFALAVSVATGVVLASVHYAPLVLEDGSVVMSDGLRDLLARVPREFAYTAVASLVGSALWALLHGVWPKPLKDAERNPSAQREVRAPGRGRSTDGMPAPRFKRPKGGDIEPRDAPYCERCEEYHPVLDRRPF